MSVFFLLQHNKRTTNISCDFTNMYSTNTTNTQTQYNKLWMTQSVVSCGIRICTVKLVVSEVRNTKYKMKTRVKPLAMSSYYIIYLLQQSSSDNYT